MVSRANLRRYLGKLAQTAADLTSGRVDNFLDYRPPLSRPSSNYPLEPHPKALKKNNYFRYVSANG